MFVPGQLFLNQVSHWAVSSLDTNDLIHVDDGSIMLVVSVMEERTLFMVNMTTIQYKIGPWNKIAIFDQGFVL